MSAATATAGEPSDPDTFLVCGAPFVIVTRSMIRADGTFPSQAVATMRTGAPVPGDPAAFVPLFTDADLAERFLAASGGGTSLVAVRVDSVGALVVLLAEFAQRLPWVGFDPHLGTGPHALYPTRAVLRAVVGAVERA